MAACKGAVVMVLTELVDSDDEKPRRGKTTECMKKEERKWLLPKHISGVKC